MGYSESVVTVEKRRGMLGPLLEGRPAKWDCPPGTERHVAYQIRECLYVARKNPKLLPELQTAAHKMEVYIVRPGLVAARMKEQLESETVTVSPADLPSTVGGLGGQQTANSIVQAWFASKKAKLHFSDARLSHEELRKLHAWTSEIKLLIFWSDPGVTIQEWDAELAPFAFNPDEDLE